MSQSTHQWLTVDSLATQIERLECAAASPTCFQHQPPYGRVYNLSVPEDSAMQVWLRENL
jgi:hypothetical protein